MIPLHTIPPAGLNNVWFHNPDSASVLVFVHGIHSDSRSSWLLENKRQRKQVYWPELIANDEQLKGFGIFLGGYSTQLASHDYGLNECARELYDHLFTAQEPAKQAILKAAKTILFLCHSTGGIVVRHMLVRHVLEFREKRVGVILMASPSRGSFWADILDGVISFYKSDLAKVLRTKDELLSQLDEDFASLVTDWQTHIPNLTGAEACEHYFIFRRTLFGRLASKIPLFPPRVVDKESAGVYWRPVKQIANTDHFSIVKPESTSDEVHNFLRATWQTFRERFSLRDTRQEIPVALPTRPQEAWIGPASFIAALRTALSECQDVAIVGSEGAGKTAAALHLVWDEEVRAAFPDGILWGPPSSSMDLKASIVEWGVNMGLTRDALLSLSTLRERELKLDQEIGDRRMLLVLDNCSSTSDAAAFKFLGSRVTRLITTRSAEVARSFAPEATFQTPRLQEDAIKRLVSSGSDDLADNPEVIAYLQSLDSSDKIISAAKFLRTFSGEEVHKFLQSQKAGV